MAKKPNRRTRVGVEQKRCNDAEHRGARWLPLSAFPADATRPDGLKYKCRVCHNRHQHEYDAEHLEEGRARARGQRAEHVAKHTIRAGEAIETFRSVAKALELDAVTEQRRPLRTDAEVRDAIAHDIAIAEAEPAEAERLQVELDRVDRGRGVDVDARRQAVTKAEQEDAEVSARHQKAAEIARRRAAERAERLASDHLPLRPEDFDDDTSVANDPKSGPLSSQFARDKRQEYSRAMGQHAHHVRAAAAAELRGDGDLIESMPPEAGSYIGKLAEQEARFGRRRLARSLSLFAAGEEQARRLWAQACRQYLTGRVVPTGYAAKPPSSRPIKRSVCLLLSDLHLGADLGSAENPIPYRATEEARRLEFLLRQVIDYKPQYRRDSELVLMLNGDLIEGLLLHDFRDGAPLVEQKVIFQHYMERFVGECARAYPRVRLFCQPGNHGRDKVRHPGRATSSKFDGHEWGMMYALSRACTELKNVTWDLPFRAVSIIDVHGAKLGMTHGDTEVAIGPPDGKASRNAQVLAQINATRLYGVEFAGWLFGHHHTPRWIPREIREIHNGALVPPNGHARSSGFIGEVCGQFLFEAVPDYPIGDVRFLAVGRAQDTDEKLGKLITPFRFSLD